MADDNDRDDVDVDELPDLPPDELLSAETITQWERPALDAAALTAAVTAGPPAGFGGQYPWHAEPGELPAFRAAAVAGYWAARCALGPTADPVATADQKDAWDERIEEVVHAMDVVGLSFEWNGDMADACAQLLLSVMVAHDVDQDQDEPAGFMTFGFDQALAYALVEHDLAHDRLPELYR